MPVRKLPAKPDLAQLKHQARDLLNAFRDADPSAVTDFTAYAPVRIDASDAKLSDAQLVLARSYQTSGWPQLVVACEVIKAVTRDDFDALRAIVAEHPGMFRNDGDARTSGWRASLTDSANAGLRRTIQRMQSEGVRGVAAAMQRPDMHKWLDALRLLGRVGARPPSDAIGGAVETLNGADIAFMAGIGADLLHHGGLAALALETYARNPEGKHKILEVMVEQGVQLPDTAPMAVHRGRIDLLEQHLLRDPTLLTRTFSHQDIWPPALECHADETLALHGAPLANATLLHMATDYEELEIARWLMEQGMDANVRAAVDVQGFGGHTALFNCVISYNAGRRDSSLAQLLLERGADPNARASLRKALAFARDDSVHEYRNVTPLGWGRAFHDQTYVCQSALRVIESAGGRD